MSNALKTSLCVTAVVPARNEEAVIGACVESLAVQPEIGEVLVVNDQSTDATPAVVAGLMSRYANLRLLETKGLPAGWVGKNNAVWLGARQAQGEWLLFTDADAVHEKDSAAKALRIAAKENAVMVSFSPAQVMETWYEKSLIPYVYCRLGSKFSYGEVNDPANPAAAANGQFVMIRKDAYQAVGGHASVAGDVLEDVALAKRVKGAGHRIWFASGKGIVRVRMYRAFRAMWEGWKKNLYPLMGNSVASLAKEFARAVGPVLLALIASVALFFASGSVAYALAFFLLAVIAVSLMDGLELQRNGLPPDLGLLAIPGRVLFALVLGASYRSHRRGKLEWKGREYPAGTPDASK